MLETIDAIDKKWLIYLNGLGSEQWDNFWIILTNKWTSIPLYIFLLFLCFRYKKYKEIGLILLCTALLILCTDQFSNLFKYGFERLRPCHNQLINQQLRIFKCGGKFGYFSAHAANSFALVTFFGFLFRSKVKLLPLFLFSWALLVSYSRIYLAVHYPFDVITGIFFGIFFGIIFFKFHNFLERKILKK